MIPVTDTAKSIEEAKKPEPKAAEFLDLFVANLRAYQSFYRAQPVMREQSPDIIYSVVFSHVAQSIENARKGEVYDPRKAIK